MKNIYNCLIFGCSDGTHGLLRTVIVIIENFVACEVLLGLIVIVEAVLFLEDLVLFEWSEL